MFFTLKNGEEVEIKFPKPEVIHRLERTCFRGQSVRLAHNLFYWEDYKAFLKDPIVLALIAPFLSRLISRPFPYLHNTHRCEIEFDYPVGWKRVAYLEDLSKEDISSCERDALNKNASALILPNDRIKAPQTKLITVAVGIRFIGHWQFGIWDMYPGPDLGKVEGDMTYDQGYVWFRWSNPGEEEIEVISSKTKCAEERLSA